MSRLALGLGLTGASGNTGGSKLNSNKHEGGALNLHGSDTNANDVAL